MKRLNPNTGLFFKKGDIRKNGDRFYQYRKIITPWSEPYFVEYWLKPKLFENHNYFRRSGGNRLISEIASQKLKAAKTRCAGTLSRKRKATNGKVTITKQWVVDRINAGVCEATGDALTISAGKHNSPSLDRIDPNNPDYTPENCRVTTWQFNNMKGAYSDKEFIRVAKQLEIIKKKSTAPIPTRPDQPGKIHSELRASTSAGFGQDSDNADHHCGADAGQDADHCAQTGSRDSVGRGGAEVGAPKAPESQQDNGKPPITTIWP